MSRTFSKTNTNKQKKNREHCLLNAFDDDGDEVTNANDEHLPHLVAKADAAFFYLLKLNYSYTLFCLMLKILC